MEISVRGRWINVPAFEFGDHTIIITGKLIRTACVHDEAWKRTELRDPEVCLSEIARQHPSTDVFTFSQMPPARPAEFRYRSVRDSIAVISLTTFDDWWTRLPQETRKNVRRAARCGVSGETKQFDEELVKG